MSGDSPVVCVCGGVTERELIAACTRDATVEDLSARTGAAMNCGDCRPDLADVLEQWHMDHSGFRQASGADVGGEARRHGTVIVLDYPDPNVEKRLRQLELEKQGFDVRYVLDEVLPREVEVVSYAAALYRACLLDRVEVSALLAYCLSGQIARELCELCLRDSGRRPPVILINPEDLSADAMAAELAPVLNTPLPLGGTVTPEETMTALENIERRMIGAYIEDLGDDSDAIAEDLTRMQLGWAFHLIAAGTLAADSDVSQEIHLTSGDHACPATCRAQHTTLCESSDDIFAVATPTVVAALEAGSPPQARPFE